MLATKKGKKSWNRKDFLEMWLKIAETASESRLQQIVNAVADHVAAQLKQRENLPLSDVQISGLKQSLLSEVKHHNWDEIYAGDDQSLANHLTAVMWQRFQEYLPQARSEAIQTIPGTTRRQPTQRQQKPWWLQRRQPWSQSWWDRPRHPLNPISPVKGFLNWLGTDVPGMPGK